MRNEVNPVMQAVWVDIYKLWTDYGKCQTDDDWNAFHSKASALCQKYRTQEHDLCLKLALALMDVAEGRWKAGQAMELEKGGTTA